MAGIGPYWGGDPLGHSRSLLMDKVCAARGRFG